MTTTNPAKYLSPDTVSRLKNMQLRAKLVVEGFIAGLHKSPYHGFSTEFTEHRPYFPGDPLKIIDWRVYGRTDRFFVKQYEDETNLKAYLLLDCSASMGYTSGKLTKLQYASYLAAALAYLLLLQRDAAGLLTFDTQIRQYLPPRSMQGYLNPLLSQLENTVPGGETDIGGLLHQTAERIKRRGLVILLSDLLDEPQSILNGLKHFRHLGHEVLVFHLLDPQERDFAFKGNVLFKDLETGEKLPVSPEHLQSAYREEFRGFLQQMENGCREHRIDYMLFGTDQSYDQTLFHYLHKRMMMR